MPDYLNKVKIVINGEELDGAKKMTLWVAIGNFYMEMSEPNALGDEQLRNLYLENVKSIIKMVHSR